MVEEAEGGRREPYDHCAPGLPGMVELVAVVFDDKVEVENEAQHKRPKDGFEHRAGEAVDKSEMYGANDFAQQGCNDPDEEVGREKCHCVAGSIVEHTWGGIAGKEEGHVVAKYPCGHDSANKREQLPDLANHASPKPINGAGSNNNKN